MQPPPPAKANTRPWRRGRTVRLRTLHGRARVAATMKCIAVDWSGAKKESDQRKWIWLAEAIDGELVRLEGGRTRKEVVDLLVAEVQPQGALVVGLDFAFSFPEWYLADQGVSDAPSMWRLAACNGEDWLEMATPSSFWDGQKQTKPPEFTRDNDLEFRKTDREVAASKIRGGNPESVFKLVGPRQVGRGSVRGQPFLLKLQDAGAAIWPFDNPVPGKPIVVEIYPRLLTGGVVKSNPGRRLNYLARSYPDIDPQWRRAMEASDDAFDAGVSALVMSANAENLRHLQPDTASRYSLEGRIWAP